MRTKSATIMSAMGKIRDAPRWLRAETRQHVTDKNLSLRTVSLHRSVTKRHLVQNFWAKAWCRNLDTYEDYIQRLARGRSYVRNGCLLDLTIEPGEICARVSGAELHRINIKIATLGGDAWQRLVEACASRIGSLVELFSGTLQEQTIALLVDERYGLFPGPTEIRFSCDCLDEARMCEHVAATLYGVAVRLDTAPELFFTLRGVDQAELVRRSGKELQEISDREAASLDIRGMEDLFGIEIHDDSDDKSD